MDSKLLKKIKRESEKKNKDKNALPSTTLIFNGRYEILFLIDIRNNLFIYKAFDSKEKKFVIIKEFFPVNFSKKLSIKRDQTTLDIVENAAQKEYYKQLVDDYLLHIDAEELLYGSKQISLFKEHNTAYIVYKYNEWPSLQNIMDSHYNFTSDDIHYIYFELFKFIEDVKIYKYLNTSNIYVKNTGLVFINNNIKNIYSTDELSLYTSYEQTFFSDEVKFNKELSKKVDLFSIGTILKEIIQTLDEDKDYNKAIKKVKSHEDIDKFIQNATMNDMVDLKRNIQDTNHAEAKSKKNMTFKQKYVLALVAFVAVIGFGVLFTNSIYLDFEEEIPLGKVEMIRDIEVDNLILDTESKLEWNQTDKVSLNSVIIKNDEIEVEIPMYTDDRSVDLSEYKIHKGKYELFFRYNYLDSHKELRFKLVVK